MSSEDLEIARTYLPVIGFLGALSYACFHVAIHRGRVPTLAFRPASGPREPPLWRAADVALAIAAWFLASIAAGVAFAPLDAPPSPAGALPAAMEVTPYALLASVLIPNLAALAVIFAVVRKRLGQPWSAVGLARAPARNVVPVLSAYVLLFLPLGFVSALWQHLLLELGQKPVPQGLVELYKKSVHSGDGLTVAVVVVSGVIVAPFCEELIYRGFFFGRVREGLGPILAALLSSAVFAAVHGSLSASVPILGLGCILCYLYQRTRSLYPAMLFHAVFNGVSLAAAALA